MIKAILTAAIFLVSCGSPQHTSDLNQVPDLKQNVIESVLQKEVARQLQGKEFIDKSEKHKNLEFGVSFPNEPDKTRIKILQITQIAPQSYQFEMQLNVDKLELKGSYRLAGQKIKIGASPSIETRFEFAIDWYEEKNQINFRPHKVHRLEKVEQKVFCREALPQEFRIQMLQLTRIETSIPGIVKDKVEPIIRDIFNGILQQDPVKKRLEDRMVATIKELQSSDKLQVKNFAAMHGVKALLP